MIPRGKETGAETWTERKSARYGGGGSWTTYAIEKITCRNLICCVGLTGVSISAGCGST
ncbi:MAG: hypothetical protein HYX63_04120 [Gammaproteobacteria bacterium]|nr:hypothetical protein [Gammaproteobacteria bacterium]